MPIRIEKARPKDDTLKLTSNSKAQSASEITARMHFYAIRNAGDQLRWASRPRTNKKPDRMVGR